MSRLEYFWDATKKSGTSGCPAKFGQPSCERRHGGIGEITFLGSSGDSFWSIIYFRDARARAKLVRLLFLHFSVLRFRRLTVFGTREWMGK